MLTVTPIASVRAVLDAADSAAATAALEALGVQPQLTIASLVSLGLTPATRLGGDSEMFVTLPSGGPYTVLKINNYLWTTDGTDPDLGATTGHYLRLAYNEGYWDIAEVSDGTLYSYTASLTDGLIPSSATWPAGTGVFSYPSEGSYLGQLRRIGDASPYQWSIWDGADWILFAPMVTPGELTPALVASKLGEALIAQLKTIHPSSAGVMHFATTMDATRTITLYTSTGYARLINSDGTLGVPTPGDGGAAGTEITLTIPAGSGLRALGVMSVASDGTTPSGNITAIMLQANQLTSVSLTALSALTSFNLTNNQLTSINLSGLTSLTGIDLGFNQLSSIDLTGLVLLSALYLNNNLLASISLAGLASMRDVFTNNNQLTSEAQDAAFLSLPGERNAVGGYWFSAGNLGTPTDLSAAKRAAMVSGNWTITY